MTAGDRRRGDMALVLALAEGCTVEEAAKRAHVSPATVYRRRREPEFRAAVNEARRESWVQAVGRMAAATTQAAETLKALLDSPMDQVRVAAARSILEHAAKGIDTVELEERLKLVEERLAAQPSQGVRRVG
jgi:soluble lytic murein transglycosylase-like protein